MTFTRPLLLTLRGAADNGSRMPGGGPWAVGETRLNPASPRYSRIARTLFAVWLLCWPVAAFGHDVPTSRDVGCLSAGASCPGQLEG